jgi:hypothetical protein
LENKNKNASDFLKENAAEAIETINTEVNSLFKEVFALGQSSLSLAKLIIGKNVNKREEEVVKNNIKGIGKACIYMAGYLPGINAALPFVEKMIETKPTPGLLKRVIDNDMKREWLSDIKACKDKPTLLDKLANKLKGEGK